MIDTLEEDTLFRMAPAYETDYLFTRKKVRFTDENRERQGAVVPVTPR